MPLIKLIQSHSGSMRRIRNPRKMFEFYMSVYIFDAWIHYKGKIMLFIVADISKCKMYIYISYIYCKLRQLEGMVAVLTMWIHL